MVNAQNIVDTQNGRWASPSLPLTKMAGMLVIALLIASILMVITVFVGGTLPATLGFKTMVVTSGSMEPAIHVGDAVILRPTPPESVAWQFKDGFIRTGDVITFTPLGGGGLVTHRVVDIKEIQGETHFQTQGDTNNTPDPNLAVGGAVYGKVTWTLPKLGYLIHFAATPFGKLTFIGVPLLILMGQEVRKLLRDRKASRHKDMGHANLDEDLFGEAFLDEALLNEDSPDEVLYETPVPVQGHQGPQGAGPPGSGGNAHCGQSDRGGHAI